MKIQFLLVFAVAVPLAAAILDRLAITVGSQVITEQQLDEELRVTAFLNHEKISRTEDSQRAAADHLVEQLLVRREMELSHYPLPDAAEIAKYRTEVEAGFGTPIAFAQALAQYDLTEATLNQHLGLQLTTLQFIEYRFRPNMGISNSDIQEAYEREVVAWRANHPTGTPPTLEASREAIRKALLEERTDQILDTWLEETRKQVSIVYLDKALR